MTTGTYCRKAAAKVVKPPARWWLGLIPLAFLTACGPPELPETQRINGIDWILVEMDGLPWGADASLRIDGDRLTGVGPCNVYSGAQAATPPGFSAQGLNATLMACADPLRSQAEARYLGHLARAEAIRRDRSRLILTGPGVEMIFEQREARGDEVF
ncbi:META domain-containing protein [Paracoccus xiamenensis]|uniref:META domain-containing protein n=1 Tax=Paracoccus xiamenensis TaxID=2714901 RepID=UPI00140BE78A|nr:META domain-containing protein [Paracoccus xiamenensis]NHF74730.1 META domain-containing protein [Paracoccus xiamenensis]